MDHDAMVRPGLYRMFERQFTAKNVRRIDTITLHGAQCRRHETSPMFYSILSYSPYIFLVFVQKPYTKQNSPNAHIGSFRVSHENSVRSCSIQDLTRSHFGELVFKESIDMRRLEVRLHVNFIAKLHLYDGKKLQNLRAPNFLKSKY